MEMFKSNIREAIDAYIRRVDDTPAMGTTIKLYPGAEDSPYVRRRPALLTFLKGSAGKREELKRKQPVLYKKFEDVWKVRNAHMVETYIPSKYLFLLRCCGSAECIHPACTGEPLDLNWYPDGPSIEVLPSPIINVVPSENPCVQCAKSHCPGHYKKELPTSSDVPAPIPSIVIVNEVDKSDQFSVDRYKQIARKCIVRPQTVQFYADHLKQVKLNRARGVEKARATRLAKKNNTTKNVCSSSSNLVFDRFA